MACVCKGGRAPRETRHGHNIEHVFKHELSLGLVLRVGGYKLNGQITITVRGGLLLRTVYVCRAIPMKGVAVCRSSGGETEGSL